MSWKQLIVVGLISGLIFGIVLFIGGALGYFYKRANKTHEKY